jgi:4-hydroxyphenylpyruvate dioxygenase
VQYIGAGRVDDWSAFYAELFGMRALPSEKRYGILPKGRILQSPDFDGHGGFFLQQIEPEPDTAQPAQHESLQRVGLGSADVLANVQLLRERGVGFVESTGLHSGERGALTQSYLGGVMFELVHDTRSR